MYYLILGLLKLFSLLPLRVLYILGDGIYVLLVYVTGYRKKVVMQNLQIAFPEKTEAERQRIMKDFYHNLCDTFMEIIKLFYWSPKQILRRMEGNIELLNQYKGTSRNVQVITGHFFNWEIANLAVGGRSALPFLGVYMPLTNKIMERIFFDMRSKTGTILISATDFRNHVSEHLKKQYALILVGDQNPGNLHKAQWLYFFNKPTAFVSGPAKGAIMNNTVVLYADFYKVRRGYYRFDVELITETPTDYTEGQLTTLLAHRVEAAVRERPSNYLWSHRRWKHQWSNQYLDKWVDDRQPPLS